jgi:Ricin-type beta-trefoil lectin domain-like
MNRKVNQPRHTDLSNIAAGSALLSLSVLLASCGQSAAPATTDTSSPAARMVSLSSAKDGAVFMLANACSNKVLDVSDAGQNDGANIIQWSANNGANQRWKLAATDSGFYKLIAQHSNKVMDVADAGSTSGSLVQQWTDFGTFHQQWKLTDMGSDQYKLTPRHAAAQALEVRYGNADDGAQVQIYEDNGTCSQRWSLTEVGTAPATGDSVPNTLQTLIDDMTLLHEARPHGVPEEINWAKGPRVGMGNNPGTFRALTAWGQLYESIDGNPASNTRVQISDIQTYVLSKADGTWRQVQKNQSVEGAAYVEDFAGDANKPADLRLESSGGISVKAGGGYNFHFWPPDSRATIEPSDIGGVWTTVRARLIQDDPSKPDDRGQARYVLSMGADYWLDGEAKWDQWKTNGDVGIGRFKYVKEAWQSFNMTSLSADQLRLTPPPLN